MSKTTKSDRKRTITVTLGTRTEQMLELLRTKMSQRNPGMEFDLTTAARCVMAEGMVAYLKHYDIVVDKSWSNTFQ